MMTIKIVRISGNDEILGVWEMERIPLKDETISLTNGKTYRVVGIETELRANGGPSYVVYVA